MTSLTQQMEQLQQQQEILAHKIKEEKKREREREVTKVEDAEEILARTWPLSQF